MVKSATQGMISSYFYRNISFFVFIAIIFAIGVVIGAFSVYLVHDNDRYELGSYIETFLRQFDAKVSASKAGVVRQSMFGNLKTMTIIYLLGLSVIGVPAVLVVVFVRGFVLGFTVGFLIDELLYKGILLAFISVFPQNLILIPCTIILSVAAISFSGAVIKNKIAGGKPRFAREFLKFSIIMVLMTFAVIPAAFVEGYVTPFLIHLCIGIII
jgi:stage II sporulation protein M